MNVRLPLRTRLTLAFAAGMAVVLAALGAFLYVRVGHDLMNAIDMDLRSRAQVLAGAIGRSQPGADPVRSRGSLIDPDEAFAQVLGASGRIVDSSSAVAAAPMLSRAALRSVAGPTFFTTRVRGVDDPVRLLAFRHGTDFVVVGATLGDRNEAMGRIALALAVAGPVALGAVAGAGWALAGAALRPVERMRREAAAISLSEPARRLAVPPTGDELARLAATLNDMLDRLQEAVQRKERFLDEASHELRTPLGVLRMELDLALARARTPQELETALRNASAETDRLVRLAEDLLVLSRTSAGTLPVHRRTASLAELVERGAEANRARAAAAGIEIHAHCQEGLTAVLDPERIRQAIDDLVDNSLRHTPAGGTITLSAARRDGRVLVGVRDTGAGFPSDLLQKERPGGAEPEGGLGLSIVNAIARAHGGTVRLGNPDGGGALVELELPLEPAPELPGKP
ncbi:MAG: ATP-binding protein [Actinomycetota bacterium]|nr:ATP-binding protein [Actinomycetota bacterium]